MQNLVTTFNLKLPGLRAADDVSAHTKQLQQQAISNYLKTGKIQKVQFGVWTAPLINGGVNVSRAIIVGSYLGTDNMLQLADTYGYFMNAGLYIGVQGLPANIGVSGNISGSVSYTYTHLKPITDLKQATSEPLKKIYVPGLMQSAAGIFTDVSNMNPGTVTVDQSKLSTQISNTLEQLKDFIDVGESLILTQSVSGAEGAKGTIVDLSSPITPSLTLSADAGQLVVGRIHFYRKDYNTIQVFKDQGEVLNFTLAAEVAVGYPYNLPVFRISATSVTGAANSKIYVVNIDSSLTNNPTFFANAVALHSALAQQNTEVLDSVQKPTQISARFTDMSSSMSFFVWVSRTLKTQGSVTITMPDGSVGHFIDLTDGSQSGVDYQALTTNVATYMLERLTKDKDLAIDTNPANNPGHTYDGNSTTREIEYQTRTDSGLNSPFIMVKYKWEGWEMAQADVITLMSSLSQKYGVSLYPKDFIKDTDKVQLYDFSLSIRFYQTAINTIVKTALKNQAWFDSRYGSTFSCGVFAIGASKDQKTDGASCGALDNFDAAVNLYRQGVKDPLAKAQLQLAIVSSLEQFADFATLVKTAGGLDNIYMNSEIQGFRVGSETLSEPIFSNAFGKADPFMPEGVLSSVENTIGILDGEFDFQWLRDFL